MAEEAKETSSAEKIPEENGKSAVIQGFEKIASELRKEGYTVLLCVAPHDPETGGAPRIAGILTYQGTSEDPQEVTFRTVEQMGLTAGIMAPGGNA